MSIWDDGRNLIGGGENLAALDLLESFLKGQVQGSRAARARTLLTDVVMLRAQSRRLLEAIRRGTLTENKIDVERARMDQAILSLIDEVERMDQLRPPTVAIEIPGEVAN